MSEQKHTPGPWVSAPQRTNTLIVAANGTRVAESYGVTDEEPRANARLIAAAPELLAALKEILGAETWESEGHNRDNAPCHVGICSRSECGHCKRYDAARAAIAKAESR